MSDYRAFMAEVRASMTAARPMAHAIITGVTEGGPPLPTPGWSRYSLGMQELRRARRRGTIRKT